MPRLFIVLCFTGCIVMASDAPLSPIVDENLYRKAELVVRARIKKPGEGSKYYWTDITPISVWKLPTGFTIPNRLRVASHSSDREMKPGTATLYLVRYNPEHPQNGWKLLGYSHETWP